MLNIANRVFQQNPNFGLHFLTVASSITEIALYASKTLPCMLEFYKITGVMAYRNMGLEETSRVTESKSLLSNAALPCNPPFHKWINFCLTDR